MTAYRPNCRRIPELNGLRVLLVFIVSWYHLAAVVAYAVDWPLLAGLSAARWIYAG